MGVAEGLGATVGFGVLLPGGDELVLATVGVTVLPSSTLVPVGVAVPPGVSVPAPESPLPEIRVAVGVVVKIGTAIVIVDVALTGLVAEGWRETAVPVAASSPGKGVVKMGVRHLSVLSRRRPRLFAWPQRGKQAYASHW